MARRNINPMNDLVAKKVFSDTKVTATFIQDILDIPVKNVKLLDTGQITISQVEDGVSVYNTVLDVLTELDDGKKVIIEIQIVGQSYFINRLWVYLCNQVSKNFDEVKQRGVRTHNTYGEVMPVYAIAVVQENYFEDDRAIRVFSIQDKETHEQLKISIKDVEGKYNLMEMAIIELKKYRPELKDEYKKIRWMEFFGNKDFTKEPDEIIHRADDVLEINDWTQEEKIMYDAMQRKIDAHIAMVEYYEEKKQKEIEEGREEGRAEGIEQGIEQERLKNIKNFAKMVKNGYLTKELAAEGLGISISEFEKYL